MRRASVLWFTLGLWLASSVLGCSATTRINVQTSEDTNGGKPLYMMVRKADERLIVTETYHEVADKLFGDETDPSIVQASVVIPGAEPIPVIVNQEEGEDIVVYFFFTSPEGEHWYVPLKSPLPEEVHILLGERGIVQPVRVRR